MTQGSKSIGEEMAEVMTHPEGRSKDNKPSDDEQIEAGSHEALTHGSKAAVSGAEAYATGNPLKALEAAHEAHKGLQGAQQAAEGLQHKAEESDEKADAGMNIDPNMALTMGG